MQRFRPFLLVLGFATAFALLVRLVVIENYRIASDSMSPALMTGDLVFVWKAAYNLRLPFSTYEIARFHEPKASDVVAFTLPEHPTETYVKRVIGLGGEKLMIRDNKIFRNGVPWDFKLAEGVPDYGPVDIPPGSFFALGDNLKVSIDSRTWGPIPNSCLKGRVALVWASLDPQSGSFRSGRAGIFPH